MTTLGRRPTLLLVATLLGVFGGPSSARSVQRTEPTNTRWLIVPAGRVADIEATSSLSELEKRFGPENVQQAKINLGEGDFADGTVLYPQDPTRRVDIVWKDKSQRAPATLRVHGNASQWGIAPGITLGTSLKEIERLNGGPFTLTGFAYDYSGTITDWNGGRLAPLRTGLPHAFIRLEPGTEAHSSMRADYAEVNGDHDFSSRREAMQRLNPKVYELVISYEPMPSAGLACAGNIRKHDVLRGSDVARGGACFW